MTSDVAAMSDAEIDRLLDRYRSYLAALDWEEAYRFETLDNYRAFLASQIRRLEGERERRTD